MTPKGALERIVKIPVRPAPDNSLDLVAMITAKKALQKQIPQRFIIKDDYDFCPSCDYNFGADAIRKTLRHWKMDYCINCGQALDWG